ncbi:MAG TPA: sugar phosphate isomerase/epimerase family protein [Limnochordia bacterium]|nr:sugar phosphate isomerase/epimerase family protein [Limnochordia bacterium]
MKVGLNAGIFPGGTTPAQSLELAVAAGCDGLELNIAETGPLSLETSDAQLDELAAKARALGLELPTIHCGLHWKYTLTDPDPAVREKGVQVLERALAIGARLGCKVLLVVPGTVTLQVGYETAMQRARAGVARLIPTAQKLGLQIGIENVGNRLMLSPLEFREFVAGFGTETVGAYFDVGNILAYGYPHDWIRTLGRQLCAVHFKDYRVEGHGRGQFVYLREGDVPWREVMQALREVGYDGYVQAELGPYKFQPERTAPDTVRAIREILAG